MYVFVFLLQNLQSLKTKPKPKKSMCACVFVCVDTILNQGKDHKDKE